jgi:hypothetical protein
VRGVSPARRVRGSARRRDVHLAPRLLVRMRRPLALQNGTALVGCLRQTTAQPAQKPGGMHQIWWNGNTVFEPGRCEADLTASRRKRRGKRRGHERGGIRPRRGNSRRRRPCGRPAAGNRRSGSTQCPSHAAWCLYNGYRVFRKRRSTHTTHTHETHVDRWVHTFGKVAREARRGRPEVDHATGSAECEACLRGMPAGGLDRMPLHEQRNEGHLHRVPDPQHVGHVVCNGRVSMSDRLANGRVRGCAA